MVVIEALSIVVDGGYRGIINCCGWWLSRHYQLLWMVVIEALSIVVDGGYRGIINCAWKLMTLYYHFYFILNFNM